MWIQTNFALVAHP